MASSGDSRRVRVERGIYRQPNGKYAVCVRVDGRARFRTLEAATLAEARRQRELLQEAGRGGLLPLSPRLTFGEVAGRWLAEFEAKASAGERRDRTFDLYRSQLHRHLLPRLGRRRLALITAADVVTVMRRVAGGGSFAVDGQADPRRAQLRVHVRASPRLRHRSPFRPARARRAAAPAPLRPARPHRDGARPSLRRVPAPLSAAASDRRVHGHASLRGARIELGGRRLRRRRCACSPSARARPPRRAAASDRAEDARLRPGDPAPPSARGGAPPAQARLPLHGRFRLRVRDGKRHAVSPSQRVQARAASRRCRLGTRS